MTVACETYERTCHEVDDEGGTASLAFLLAKWDETCLVLRVGTGGTIVERADVEARMGVWTTTSDARFKRPERPGGDNDECPF